MKYRGMELKQWLVVIFLLVPMALVLWLYGRWVAWRFCRVLDGTPSQTDRIRVRTEVKNGE